MNKSYTLLSLYDDLLCGKAIYIERCCAEFAISVPTFRRYLCLLRSFLWEEKGLELVYDRQEEAYYIRLKAQDGQAVYCQTVDSQTANAKDICIGDADNERITEEDKKQI